MTSIWRVTNTQCSRYIDGLINLTNGVHTTCVRQLDQGWRKKKRLTENPNAFGPLTNLPDYSFADGRPTPFGTRYLNRVNKQREILKTVRQLSGQIDYAVARHQRLQREEKERKQKILDSKFKPKGDKLLIESKPEIPKISSS